MSALGNQIGGNHYKDRGIQPIEYIIKNKIGFCEGNVIKYITRWRYKNGVQDLIKAKHYLEFILEFNTKRGVNLANYSPTIPPRDYASKNNLTNIEAYIIRAMTVWDQFQWIGGLLIERSIKMVNKLIEKENERLHTVPD